MKDVDFYLTYAHSSRHRAMYISVLVGASAGATAEIAGASLEHAVIACVVGSAISEVLAATLYAKPSHKEERAIVASPQRRALIPALVAAAVMFVLSLLKIPRLEAAAIERKLIQATEGPPPYHKANAIIRTVLDNNIRLSAKGLEIV